VQESYLLPKLSDEKLADIKKMLKFMPQPDEEYYAALLKSQETKSSAVTGSPSNRDEKRVKLVRVGSANSRVESPAVTPVAVCRYSRVQKSDKGLQSNCSTAPLPISCNSCLLTPRTSPSVSQGHVGSSAPLRSFNRPTAERQPTLNTPVTTRQYRTQSAVDAEQRPAFTPLTPRSTPFGSRNKRRLSATKRNDHASGRVSPVKECVRNSRKRLRC
jgi:hypothetical protein